MIKLIMVVMLLIPCWAFAETVCKVIANADLKDMSTEELQKEIEQNNTFAKIYGDSADRLIAKGLNELAIKTLDDVINCKDQIKRIERIVKSKEKETNSTPTPLNK